MFRTAWQFIKPLLFFAAVLILIWFSLPIGHMIAVILTLISLIALIFFWWYRAARIHSYTQEMFNENNVLILGSAATRIIDTRYKFREGSNQRWLRLETPDALLKYAQSSPDRPPFAMILVCELDLEDVSQPLLGWQEAIMCAQRLFKRSLYMSLLLLQDLKQDSGTLIDYVPTWTPCRSLDEAKIQLKDLKRGLSMYCFNLPSIECRSWMFRLVELQKSIDYLSHSLLASILPIQSRRDEPLLVGVDWLDSGSLNQLASWRKIVRVNSNLFLPDFQNPWPSYVALPERLLARFPRVIRCPRWVAKLSQYLILTASFFTALALSSTWNNLQEVKQNKVALSAYRLLNPNQDLERSQAFQKLQSLQEQQRHYFQYGVPLRLGMGLHQGVIIQQALNNAINTYHPSDPQIIRLNNTALFDSGKIILKNDAKFSLQSVLIWIQSNPRKRVLIDGHTDTVGNTKSNLDLSLARAQAVRDWLVSASTFPVTHFSIQGMGDSVPLADNSTEEGRSKNRRVEITLIEY